MLLVCPICTREFEHKPRRGPRPRFCPEHQHGGTQEWNKVVRQRAVAFVDAALACRDATGHALTDALIARDATFHDLVLAAARPCGCEPGTCPGALYGHAEPLTHTAKLAEGAGL